MPLIIRAVFAAGFAVIAGRFLNLWAHPVLMENVDAVAGFLHVYGAIYGTMFAFLLFVVWGQFNGCEAGVAREAKALRELVSLCRAGRGQGCKEVVEAVQYYGTVASQDEWRCLAAGKPCPLADNAFLKIQEATLKSTAATEIEVLTRDTILRIADRAAILRAERIAMSATRIPPTLWKTLVFATLVLCLSVALLGVTSPALAAYLTGGLTLVVGLILGVVQDMDNPFEGIHNASKVPLEELKNV